MVRAYFSPDGGAMKALSEEIRGARRTLDVALYMLTAPRLAWDVVSAHKRGVKVRVVLDSRMAGRSWSEAKTLEKAGVEVHRLYLRKGSGDASDPQFHHKFCVVDGRTVVTGSFNWTVMADRSNYENLLVVHDAALAAQYTKAFEAAWTLASRQDGGEDR